MIRCLLCALALLGCVACKAPLATTAHQVVDQDDYTGAWDLAWVLPEELDPSESADDVESRSAPLGRLEVAMSGGSKERQRSGISKLLGLDFGAEPERLVARLHPPEDDGETSVEPAIPTRYDAQILHVDGRIFLTVQRFADHDWLDIWTTPLQRTFLMEATDEPGVVWLSIHPKQFVWSPSAYAGTFEFDPDALDDEGGTALVRRFDDVLDYYAARPDDEWQRMFRAKRLD